MTQSFAEEKKTIENRIWQILDVQRGMMVLDIGIGEHAASSKRLIENGARVTAIDKNFNSAIAQKEIGASLVCANATVLPFKDQAFDLSIAFFTLHEVHSHLHNMVMSELIRTSNRIAIVEPNPGDDELYSRYWNILNRAGQSIGECEVYQDICYWTRCLEKHGATIIQEKKIKHQEKLIGNDAADFFQRIIRELRAYGIAKSFLDELKTLSDEVVKHGAVFSDVSVIVARCPN
jgi:ubiquinone/menaquinone biosynthesis C-methylase UbiE